LPGRLALPPDQVKAGYKKCADSKEAKRRQMVIDVATDPRITPSVAARIKHLLVAQQGMLHVFIDHYKPR
jgi:hypothetical protein